MITIRTAQASDAGDIARVHVESWRTTYVGIVPDEYLAKLDETQRAIAWRDWLSSKTLVLVAEKDGKIIGFAHAGPNREPLENCDAELYSLYLLQKSQGHRIGTALLRRVAEALMECKFKSMMVWVLERNPSRDFYAKSGARFATSKVIEIGGTKLMEVAYSWPDIKLLLQLR